jgi:hypothetical protein
MNRLIVLGIVAMSAIVWACGSTQSPSPGPSSPAPSQLALASPSAEPSPSVAPSASDTASPSPSDSASPSPSPTATPLPTPSPTPVPWQTYTSKLYHYKISYPPNWIATPGSAKRADEFDNYDRPWVFVERHTVSGIVSVSLTASADSAYMKSHYAAKLVTTKSLKLAGGYSGKFLLYRGKDNGVAITVQEVFVAKGRVGYILTSWGYREQESPDIRLFKQMYTSWRPI